VADSKSAAIEDEPFSIGGYLQAQRKIRGIDLEELSVRTRIPMRSLTRLEAGAFDGDPDGFVRGFVRTVSDGLGLDADDTMMRMLAEPAPSRTVRVAAIGLPIRAWVALAVGGAAALAGIAFLHAALWSGPAASDTAEVVRVDPVRALAEAHAASSGAPEAPLDDAPLAASTDRQAAPPSAPPARRPAAPVSAPTGVAPPAKLRH